MNNLLNENVELIFEEENFLKESLINEWLKFNFYEAINCLWEIENKKIKCILTNSNYIEKEEFEKAIIIAIKEKTNIFAFDIETNEKLFKLEYQNENCHDKKIKLKSINLIDNSDEYLNIIKENQKLMAKKGGYYIIGENIFISPLSIIGQKTVIMSNTTIKNESIIEKNCLIGQNSMIDKSIINEHTEINSSIIIESKIGKNVKIGPFCYIRPNCVINNNVKIGDFVEIKNSVVDENTKVAHLTYIGDSDVGKNVNFGCGTVIVNYDGLKKTRTKIGNNAFIGCNSNLISPVEIGDFGYTAAGTTITDYLPPYALGISRNRQIVKPDWVKEKFNIKEEDN